MINGLVSTFLNNVMTRIFKTALSLDIQVPWKAVNAEEIPQNRMAAGKSHFMRCSFCSDICHKFTSKRLVAQLLQVTSKSF